MSSKKALLCLVLIPCMSLPANSITSAWESIPLSTRTSITTGINDGVKNLFSKLIYMPPAVIGYIAYTKWFCGNQPSDEKRSRMVRENNCRMKEITFLNSEMTKLEQKESLNDEELKELEMMKEKSNALKCALLASQCLLVKPSKEATDGTLYRKATQIFALLPS